MVVNFANLSSDIVHAICEEWLTVVELVHLDSACCNRNIRRYVMEVITNPGFCLTEDIDNVYFTKWLSIRGIVSKHLYFSNISAFLEYERGLRGNRPRSFNQVISVSVESLSNDHEDTTIFMEKISSATSLQKLMLPNCRSLLAAASIVAAISSTCRLRCLSLYDFHDYLSQPFSQHRNVLQNLLYLEELDLSFSNFDSNGDWLTNPALCPSLHTIYLNRCFPVTDEFLVKLVQCYGHQLIRLELKDCEGISDVSLQAIINVCTSLQHLEIAGCSQFTAVALEQLANASFELTSLNIGHFWFLNNAILSAIMHKLCVGQLTSLNLSRVVNGTNNQLVILLAENAPELQRLDLSFCFKVSDAGILSLAMCCPALRSINLSNCPKVTDFSIQKLVTQCMYLEELQVMTCLELTDATVIHIAETCQLLKILNLSGCTHLTDVGLWGLAAGTTRYSLRHFEISDNEHITTDTLEHLLIQCQTLRKVNATHCAKISIQQLSRLQTKFLKRIAFLEMRGYSQMVQASYLGEEEVPGAND